MTLWPEGRYPGCDIGGHSTELSTVGLLLEAELRESFPINLVPETLLSQLHDLQEALGEAEKQLEEFVLAVAATIEDEPPPSMYLAIRTAYKDITGEVVP